MFEDLLGLLAAKAHDLSTGFLGTPLLCDTLTRFGRTDLAYDLLLTETYPGWLFPVTLGATTMWERWNSWHPEKGFVDLSMNSLNHYAYGAVGDWIVRAAAGLDLSVQDDSPRLLLRPHPDARLGRCEAGYDSPWGRVESRWRCEGERVVYEVRVPEGLSAQLQLPGEEVRPLSAGEHRFETPA